MHFPGPPQSSDFEKYGKQWESEMCLQLGVVLAHFEERGGCNYAKARTSAQLLLRIITPAD